MAAHNVDPTLSQVSAAREKAEAAIGRAVDDALAELLIVTGLEAESVAVDIDRRFYTPPRPAEVKVSLGRICDG